MKFDQDYFPEPMHKSTTIEDVFFELTCYACPEQYDVFYQGKQVGYARLRHGTLRVHSPDYGGEIIYEVNWPEEEYLGLFPDYESRQVPYSEPPMPF